LNVAEAHQAFIQTLSTIYDPGEARSIARMVFEDALRLYDFQSRAPLFDVQIELLQNIKNRLLQHEPIQYILGQADFYGLKFKVDRNVLIPRQETEELVFWILETIQQEIKRTALTILDIGTGSGCIPITLQKKMPQLETMGVDVSPAALEVAQANADRHGVKTKLVWLDILDRTGWQQLDTFDLIVSNPPYIPIAEKYLLSSNVTNYEPSLALFVENDNPLLFYDAIADFAIQHLKTGDYLFFECNEFNATEVVKLLKNKHFTNIHLQKDLNGKNRMLKASCG
jgi:release factor glutamine methyltransferase